VIKPVVSGTATAARRRARGHRIAEAEPRRLCGFVASAILGLGCGAANEAVTPGEGLDGSRWRLDGSSWITIDGGSRESSVCDPQILAFRPLSTAQLTCPVDADAAVPSDDAPGLEADIREQDATRSEDTRSEVPTRDGSTSLCSLDDVSTTSCLRWDAPHVECSIQADTIHVTGNICEVCGQGGASLYLNTDLLEFRECGTCRVLNTNSYVHSAQRYDPLQCKAPTDWYGYDRTHDFSWPGVMCFEVYLGARSGPTPDCPAACQMAFTSAVRGCRCDLARGTCRTCTNADCI